MRWLLMLLLLVVVGCGSGTGPVKPAAPLTPEEEKKHEEDLKKARQGEQGNKQARPPLDQ